jgi:transposase
LLIDIRADAIVLNLATKIVLNLATELGGVGQNWARVDG